MRQQATRWLLEIISVIFVVTGLAVAQQEVVPNDPYFSSQISFKSPGGTVKLNEFSNYSSSREFLTRQGLDLNVTKAWTITTGSKDVVVAILDDGFCYHHPDLEANIWTNPGESGHDSNGFPKEANGIDDDHNGYVDDLHGWDFVFDAPDVDCHVFDGMDKMRIAPYWHSMEAMGIIGAKGNNGIGVAGINWDVSMMLLRIGVQGIARGEVDANRVGRVVRAIHYAADNGARIINWSGFVSGASERDILELHQAIEYAAKKNVLIVVAAGNQFKDLDNDANCQYPPQCFVADNLLTVAQVDFDGNLFVAQAPFIGGSNYGRRRVDIAAIGMNYTTSVTRGGVGTYRLTGGTSNAAPVVTGVAALMLSVNPALSASQLKQLLLDTAKPLPNLKAKVKCGGMVDAYAAVKAAKDALSVRK